MYRPPLPLTTERLLLREWVEEDQEAIQRLFDHEDVKAFVGSPWKRPDPDEDWSVTFARTRKQGNDGLAVCERDSGSVVGVAALLAYPFYKDESRDYELSVGIACEARRRGFAVEASRALICHALNSEQVDAVVGRVARSNEVSLRFVAQLGMAETDPVQNMDGGTDRFFELRASQGAVPAQVDETEKYRHQLLREDVHALRQEYLRERELMVQAEHASIQGFDKAMLTLSGAALAFSLSLTQFLGNGPHNLGLLQWSWLLFALAVVSTVGSLFASHLAFQHERRRVDREFVARRRAVLAEYGRKAPPADEDGEEAERNRAASITKWANRASVIFFLVGMLLLILFSSCTVAAKEHRMPDEKPRSESASQAGRSSDLPTADRTFVPDTDYGRRAATPPESSVAPLIIPPPGSEAPSGGDPGGSQDGSSGGASGGSSGEAAGGDNQG